MPGGAYNCLVKYHAAGSGSYGVKKELFQFLAQCIVSLHEEKQIFQLKAKISCLVLRITTLRIWLHATHQEADTRMIWHAGDAVQEGYRKIVLRTVDTDVLVLAIAFAGILQEQQVQQAEVLIAMGTGSHFRCIAAHEISNNLGSECPRLYQYVMPLQDAILCLASLGEARRLHSQIGRTSQQSQIPSYSLQLHLPVQ